MFFFLLGPIRVHLLSFIFQHPQFQSFNLLLELLHSAEISIKFQNNILTYRVEKNIIVRNLYKNANFNFSFSVAYKNVDFPFILAESYDVQF